MVQLIVPYAVAGFLIGGVFGLVFAAVVLLGAANG